MTLPLGLIYFNSDRTSDLSATMAAALHDDDADDCDFHSLPKTVYRRNDDEWNQIKENYGGNIMIKQETGV